MLIYPFALTVTVSDRKVLEVISSGGFPEAHRDACP
jgi:hypothetical protein